MAGVSRRFKDAGYSLPKFMLDAHGHSLFEHAVNSFQRYFDEEHFVFVHQDSPAISTFLNDKLEELGIRRATTVALPKPTRGQAETVAAGLDYVHAEGHQPLTIFNIDTFRPGFAHDVDALRADGYLETFIGDGENWSFVKADANGRVTETTEKRRISPYCCTGLYHFSQARLFMEAFDVESRRGTQELVGGELYVAPLYNRLIQQNLRIAFTVIDRSAVVFCGVPAEYNAFLRSSHRTIGRLEGDAA